MASTVWGTEPPITISVSDDISRLSSDSEYYSGTVTVSGSFGQAPDHTWTYEYWIEVTVNGTTKLLKNNTTGSIRWSNSISFPISGATTASSIYLSINVHPQGGSRGDLDMSYRTSIGTYVPPATEPASVPTLSAASTKLGTGVIIYTNRKNTSYRHTLTAFMGEPLKTLNMFMRSYDAWRFEQNTPKRSAAMKKMTRTIGAVLVTDVVNALVQSIVDAFRDDDKDKGYWARYLEKLTGVTGDKEKDTFLNVLLGSNLWDNADPLGRIPYAKDIKSLMQGFTVSRMDADAAGDFINAAQMFIRSTQDEGKKTTLYAAKQLLTAGSKIFGVSVANVGRDVWAIARSVAQESGNVRMMYEMERAIWRLAPDAGNNTRYYKLLYMAMEQDKEAYQYIYEDMKKRGYSDGQLQKGIKSVIQDSGASDADMRKQLEDIGYSGEEAQEFMDKWAFKEKYGYAYDEKRDAFVEGAISRRQLIDEMVSIDGKTRDEAAAYVTQLQCEVDTGISYNDLRGAYSAGRIRYDQAVSYLKRYGGKDDESATNTVERWKFTGDIDEYNDISVEAVAKYNEYCASTGMSEDTYYRAWSVLHSITGEDYDGDGESDRYSKMDKKLAYIGSLNISYDQMFALALASGISEKRINERAPW